MGDIVDWMFESGMMDDIDDDYMPQPSRPQPKTCKYCGKKGFSWKQTDKGWRLFKGGKVHECLSHVTQNN